MTDLPSYDLELKAADDRRRLHRSVEALKVQLREKLDIQKNAREHLGLACAVAALVCMAAGYAVTGIFVQRPR
jgi:hypothetical protein